MTQAWLDEKIVTSEIRRFCRSTSDNSAVVGSYGREDLAQEVRLAVARAAERVQSGGYDAERARRGRDKYLRQAARFELTRILKQEMTRGRCPHDAWGRPIPIRAGGRSVDVERALPLTYDGRDPETVAEQREAISYLQARLDPRDWAQLVEVFVNGASIAKSHSGERDFALVREHAAAILRRIGYRVSRERGEEQTSMSAIPKTPDDELPECHANGEAPIGYDIEDPDCTQCREKFTCLPGAVEKGLIPSDITADMEVAAVVGGHLTYDVAIQRMVRRHHLLNANKPIPEEDAHNFIGLMPDDALDAPPAAKQAPLNVPATPAPGHGEHAAEEPVYEPVEVPATVAPPDELIEALPDDARERFGVLMGEKRDALRALAKTLGVKGNGSKKELVLRLVNVELAKAAMVKPKPPKEAPPKAAPHKPPKAEKPAPAPKAKPTKPPKKVAPPKPPAKPASSGKKPLLTVEARGAKKFLVCIDGTRKGRIELHDGVWGWWTRTDESADWLDSFEQAVADMLPALAVEDVEPRVDKTVARVYRDAVKAAEAKPSSVGAAQAAPEHWPRMRDGRPYPAPRTLTEEEMQVKLEEAQAKLGANIQLDYGMYLVRRSRKGEVVVRITKHGFEYAIPYPDLVKKAKLDSPKQLFGSLSAIAFWFEGRLRTGNDFFNVAKHSCTEIRSADHRIIDRKGGAPGVSL